MRISCFMGTYCYSFYPYGLRVDLTNQNKHNYRSFIKNLRTNKKKRGI